MGSHDQTIAGLEALTRLIEIGVTMGMARIHDKTGHLDNQGVSSRKRKNSPVNVDWSAGSLAYHAADQ
jgi:hypothetical protein